MKIDLKVLAVKRRALLLTKVAAELHSGGEV